MTHKSKDVRRRKKLRERERKRREWVDAHPPFPGIGLYGKDLADDYLSFLKDQIDKLVRKDIYNLLTRDECILATDYYHFKKKASEEDIECLHRILQKLEDYVLEHFQERYLLPIHMYRFIALRTPKFGREIPMLVASLKEKKSSQGKRYYSSNRVMLDGKKTNKQLMFTRHSIERLQTRTVPQSIDGYSQAVHLFTKLHGPHVLETAGDLYRLYAKMSRISPIDFSGIKKLNNYFRRNHGTEIDGDWYEFMGYVTADKMVDDAFVAVSILLPGMANTPEDCYWKFANDTKLEDVFDLMDKHKTPIFKVINKGEDEEFKSLDILFDGTSHKLTCPSGLPKLLSRGETACVPSESP